MTLRMNEKMKQALLLLFFFLVSYILPLGARDLFVPDETRYAEVPREMIQTGDWVSPRLDGLRYFEKPVLGYWAAAGSILLFGQNPFAVRLPSALATGLSALLIYMLVARMGRRSGRENHTQAFLAALVFLSCFEVFGVGTTAVLDALFSFFLTATVAAFFVATEAAPRSSRERDFLVLSGIACGLAFLTKGFLAFAVPALALAPYLLWERRYRDLLRMGWAPLMTALLVALPWGIAIFMQEPDFWRFFFWNEHVRRFLADSAQHREPFWYFFLTAPGTFLPWTFMLPAAAQGLKGRLGEREPLGRLLRLCICWLSVPFLFFSLSSGKLVTYILPCFPPLAVLTAFGLSHAFKDRKNGLFRWGLIGNIVLFSAIVLAFVYVQLFGYQGFRPYEAPWRAVMAVNALYFVVAFSFWALRSEK